jgi:hypothetical protein
MMNGYQNKVFQAAVEIALRATLPQGGTIANVMDRLAGSTRAAAAPGEYKNADWAVDFLACLPADPEASRLVLLCYLPAYVCRCNVIHLEQGRCDDCGTWPEPYRLQPDESRRAGGLTKSFWGRVQTRRLFARGLKISECEG